MILHDLADDEKAALTEACAASHVPVCHTEDVAVPRPRRKKKDGWTINFKKREKNELHAHRIVAGVLSDPIDDEDDWQDRVGQLIMVLALGVMENHFGWQTPQAAICRIHELLDSVATCASETQTISLSLRA